MARHAARPPLVATADPMPYVTIPVKTVHQPIISPADTGMEGESVLRTGKEPILGHPDH